MDLWRSCGGQIKDERIDGNERVIKRKVTMLHNCISYIICCTLKCVKKSSVVDGAHVFRQTLRNLKQVLGRRMPSQGQDGTWREHSSKQVISSQLITSLIMYPRFLFKASKGQEGTWMEHESKQAISSKLLKPPSRSILYSASSKDL